MTRQEVFEWVRQQYSTEPEYPWNDWNAVLRHTDNRKWYGIVMEVSGNKIGLNTDKVFDVLNVKCDPFLIGSLRMQDGFFPAYHMNKDKWISILLDNPGLDDEIRNLIDMSFELTASNKLGKKLDTGTEEE